MHCAARPGRRARCRRTRTVLAGAALVALAFDAAALDADRTLHQLDHSKWTRNEGVPGQVGVLAQTVDGYLWLGTRRTLYRFDGVRFAPYVSPQGDTVATVSSLLAAPAGGLWVGLRRGGVSYVDARGIRSWGEADGLPAGTVFDLALDADGSLWAAVAEGLARFDGLRWQTIGADWQFHGSSVRAVFADRDGTLWAASGGGRLAYLPRGDSAFVDSGEAEGWIGAVAQAPDGRIWLAGRYGGTVRVHGSAVAIDVESSGIAFDRDGGLWISTLGEGVWRVAEPSRLEARTYRRGEDAIEIFASAEGLSADYSSTVLEDNEGNIWLGTSAGLDRFRRTDVVPAGFPSGAHSFALAAGRDGAIWVGTINHPAMRHANGRVVHTDIPPPVVSAYRDPGGDVWMGTSGHVWRIRADGGKERIPLPPGPNAFVRAMVADDSGTLWASLNAEGLYRFRGGSWSAVPGVSGLPSQVMPVSAAADPCGPLWFGYRDNLAVRRDGDTVRTFGPADGLDIGHVTALLPGPGRTWLAGEEGIALFDGTRVERLPMSELEPFHRVYAIIEVLPAGSERTACDTVAATPAPFGDLWVHSVAGIFVVPAADLARAAADPRHRVNYRSFDFIGELPDNPIQVIPLPTAVRGTDGRLWFATSNGVVWIDPGRLSANAIAPPVVIESLAADDDLLPVHALKPLPPLTGRVTIRYTAPSLTVPEGVRFRYRLDGYDEAWLDAGARREAAYTGLGPGDYRFRVTAANSDGVVNETGATLEFSILPAFYQTKAFIAAWVGAALLALWLTYRVQLGRAQASLRLRLAARHEERERIARELHDTLLQGVQGLMLRFQAIADRLPAEGPVRQLMEQALDRGDEVLVEGRDRVKDLRAALTDSDLPSALEHFGRDLADDGPAEYRLRSYGAARKLDPLVHDELFQLGREALANAFRHARASSICAELHYDRQEFRLRVRDNGRGFDASGPSGQDRHFGLAGMRERANRIDGRFDIRSSRDQGTVVEVTVPAATAYAHSAGTRNRTWWQPGERRRSG